MDKILKPGIVLGIICIVAATILSVAYKTTYPLIQQEEEDAKSVAMQEVLPTATSFEEMTDIVYEGVSSCFVGKDGDEIVGYAVFTDPKGYGGPIGLLTGIDTTGVITGISIITHNETPGLGANATEESFRSQYVGKSGSLAVTKKEPAGDNEILAMTSSTITTAAVTTGVNTALNFFTDVVVNGGTTSSSSENVIMTDEEVVLDMFPDTTAEKLEDVSSEGIDDVYVAKNGDDVSGYVIFNTQKGYEGDVYMATGIDTAGEIAKVNVIDDTETEGLGALASEPNFLDQYIGKTEEMTVTTNETAEDNEIVAIASATITSKAVTNGVNSALSYYGSDLKEVE